MEPGYWPHRGIVLRAPRNTHAFSFEQFYQIQTQRLTVLHWPQFPQFRASSPNIRKKMASGGGLTERWSWWGHQIQIPGLVNVNKKLWKITMLLMGKSTISMAIFNSYVSLPEGISQQTNDFCIRDSRFIFRGKSTPETGRLDLLKGTYPLISSNIHY